jgi:hypothetical protein
MKLSSGTKNLSDAGALRRGKLRALIDRWQRSLNDIRVALLAGDRRRRTKRDRRDLPAPDDAAAGELTPLTDLALEPVAAGDLSSAGDAETPEVVPSADERSQALAEVCARLLEDLDGEEVRAAEIRFVVHKHDHPGRPRLDAGSADRVSDGELVLELRRLLAWSGGAIADVARALETRGANLDESAREFLREEIEALDADVDTLHVYLADPINWDGEFGCLLAGELAPFDDPAGDEDEETDDLG